MKLNKGMAPEIVESVRTVEAPGELADTVAAQLQLKMQKKQALLEMVRPIERLLRLTEILKAEIEILQAERKMRTRARRPSDKRREEPFAAEPPAVPTRDVGERDEWKSELAELEARIEQIKLSSEAQHKVRRELRKLRLMAPMSAEATVVRGYIDWVLSLPWGVCTEDRLDVAQAERVLDEDHFGLRKVKERILE